MMMKIIFIFLYSNFIFLTFFISPVFAETNLINLCEKRDILAKEMTDVAFQETIKNLELGIKNSPLIKNSKIDNYLTELGKIGRNIESTLFAINNSGKFEKAWKIFNFDPKSLEKIGNFSNYDSVQLSNWQSFMKSLYICMSYKHKDQDKIFPGLKELFAENEVKTSNEKVIDQTTDSLQTNNPYDYLNFVTEIPIQLTFQEKIKLINELPQSLPQCQEKKFKKNCAEVTIEEKYTYIDFYDDNGIDKGYFSWGFEEGKAYNQFWQIVDTSFKGLYYTASSDSKILEAIEISGNDLIYSGKLELDINSNISLLR